MMLHYHRRGISNGYVGGSRSSEDYPQEVEPSDDKLGGVEGQDISPTKTPDTVKADDILPDALVRFSGNGLDCACLWG